MRQYDHRRSIAVARAALRQGPMTREKTGWRFGRRRFSFVIVREMIDAGEAVCVGEHLVAWRAPHA